MDLDRLATILKNANSSDGRIRRKSETELEAFSEHPAYSQTLIAVINNNSCDNEVKLSAAIQLKNYLQRSFFTYRDEAISEEQQKFRVDVLDYVVFQLTCILETSISHDIGPLFNICKKIAKTSCKHCSEETMQKLTAAMTERSQASSSLSLLTRLCIFVMINEFFRDASRKNNDKHYIHFLDAMKPFIIDLIKVFCQQKSYNLHDLNCLLFMLKLHDKLSLCCPENSDFLQATSELFVLLSLHLYNYDEPAYQCHCDEFKLLTKCKKLVLNTFERLMNRKKYSASWISKHHIEYAKNYVNQHADKYLTSILTIYERVFTTIELHDYNSEDVPTVFLSPEIVTSSFTILTQFVNNDNTQNTVLKFCHKYINNLMMFMSFSLTLYNPIDAYFDEILSSLSQIDWEDDLPMESVSNLFKEIIRVDRSFLLNVLIPYATQMLNSNQTEQNMVKKSHNSLIAFNLLYHISVPIAALTSDFDVESFVYYIASLHLSNTASAYGGDPILKILSIQVFGAIVLPYFKSKVNNQQVKQPNVLSTYLNNLVSCLDLNPQTNDFPNPLSLSPKNLRAGAIAVVKKVSECLESLLSIKKPEFKNFFSENLFNILYRLVQLITIPECRQQALSAIDALVSEFPNETYNHSVALLFQLVEHFKSEIEKAVSLYGDKSLENEDHYQAVHYLGSSIHSILSTIATHEVFKKDLNNVYQALKPLFIFGLSPKYSGYFSHCCALLICLLDNFDYYSEELWEHFEGIYTITQDKEALAKMNTDDLQTATNTIRFYLYHDKNVILTGKGKVTGLPYLAMLFSIIDVTLTCEDIYYFPPQGLIILWMLVEFCHDCIDQIIKPSYELFNRYCSQFIFKNDDTVGDATYDLVNRIYYTLLFCKPEEMLHYAFENQAIGELVFKVEYIASVETRSRFILAMSKVLHMTARNGLALPPLFSQKLNYFIMLLEKITKKYVFQVNRYSEYDQEDEDYLSSDELEDQLDSYRDKEEEVSDNKFNIEYLTDSEQDDVDATRNSCSDDEGSVDYLLYEMSKDLGEIKCPLNALQPTKVLSESIELCNKTFVEALGPQRLTTLLEVCASCDLQTNNNKEVNN